jgi:diguanylate cyclase (GGDEF)-like protein
MHPGQVADGARALRLLAAAIAAAALATPAGGSGWWLALPLALWMATEEQTPREGLFGALLILVIAFVVAPPPIGPELLAAPLSLAAVARARVRLERQRDQMRRFALRDPLTGLANRRALDERLRQEIARHGRSAERFAVLALDLDGFKPINDRFGHEAGDDLLREVAAALVGAVRAQDTVVRLGGDEFCILAPDTGPEGVRHLEERVLDALASITAGVAGLSGSVGTALYPDDGTVGADLLAAADATVIAAKRRRYGDRTRRRAA